MTSITRPTIQRTAAGLLLLGLLPTTNADCFIDEYVDIYYGDEWTVLTP
jgi:hypothetical protein